MTGEREREGGRESNWIVSRTGYPSDERERGERDVGGGNDAAVHKGVIIYKHTHWFRPCTSIKFHFRVGRCGPRLIDTLELSHGPVFGGTALSPSCFDTPVGEGVVVAEVLFYVHRNRRLIRDRSPGRPPRLSHSSRVQCCFTSTETVGLLGTGAQDGHLDFHTAPELSAKESSVSDFNVLSTKEGHFRREVQTFTNDVSA